MRKLILTADDFGLSLPVNEAIEEAHRFGVLGTASLMVGAKAARDAIDRARRLPSLRVGLHLVLVAGVPVSPAGAVPHLVDSGGEFSSRLFRAGINFFFRPEVRRELEQEISAQFQAFRKTGLPLDHVNCHKHMHLHPTIGSLILKVGRDYGLKAVRYPYEPVIPSWRCSQKDLVGKMISRVFLFPWLGVLERRLRRARVRSNQFLFGLNDSGNMNLELVLRFLEHLPFGVSEIYFHPSVGQDPEMERAAKNYRYREEFAALTDPALKHALRDFNIQCIGFGDL